MSLTSMISDLPQKERVSAFGLEDESSSTTEDGQSAAWDALAKFIPVEVLAPYTAAMSMAQEHAWDSRLVYQLFVVLTPALFVIFLLANKISTGKPLPKRGPIFWRAIAATIAFSVWALAVPTNPYQAFLGGAATVGFLAVAISPILKGVDTIVLHFLGSAK